MLEQIFGSKTRLKLLQLLLNNPENAFYLRQLARRLDSQLNSIRREILNLERIGIIQAVDQKRFMNIKKVEKKSFKKSNYGQSLKKYYRVNADHMLYTELKALILKTQLLLESDFIKKVKKIGTIYYYALTGFFVGNQNQKVDMLLVGRVNRKKLTSLVKEFEKELNHSINYTVMSKSEFKYRKDITDHFLYSILEGSKMVVVDKL